MERVTYLVIKVEESTETGKKTIKILREYKGHQVECIQKYVKKG
uniref:Uncharacterized protein n=1 Tax=uncultured prokaryote TaxID=198431 RepID=A0A0H5Q676_9ZZZZ|nr:hypothetical protein [uncultured prokaryote]